jgi:transposase InsO family protein
MTTNSMLVDHIVAVCGWPKIIYTDNGKHFTGSLTQELLRTHGVIQITAPVYSPSSVGLAKRYVNLLMGRLRTYAISHENAKAWGLLFSFY